MYVFVCACGECVCTCRRVGGACVCVCVCVRACMHACMCVYFVCIVIKGLNLFVLCCISTMFKGLNPQVSL